MSISITFLRHAMKKSFTLDPEILIPQDYFIIKDNFDVVFSSPYLRTRQTAQLFSGKCTNDVRLSEYVGGRVLSGKLDSETEKYNVPDTIETWEQFTKRLDYFYDYICTFSNKNILVITHGV